MKTIRVLAGAVALCAIVLFATACSDPAAGALTINDVKSDPTAFSGELKVTGIMAAVHPQDPRVIGVMDKAELTCTSANCNKFYLPVRYDGDRPKFGDEIVVTGTFQPNGLFVASTVQVLRNHKL